MNFEVEWTQPMTEGIREFLDKIPTQKTESEIMPALVAYTRLLRARHPQWSAAKVKKKVSAHFNIKWI